MHKHGTKTTQVFLPADEEACKTLFTLQHCLHYNIYNIVYTMHLTMVHQHSSLQDNLIFLKCSQFIDVPHWGIELLLALATAQFSILVVQG